MTALQFCPYCARPLAPDQRFCDGCGRDITPLVQASTPQQPPAPVYQAPPVAPAVSQAPGPYVAPPAVPSAGSKTPLLLGAGLLAIVVIAAVFLLKGGSNDGSGGGLAGAKPFTLSFDKLSSWEERKTATSYVMSDREDDFDLRVKPKGSRISIQRTQSGNVDLASVLKETLGSKQIDAAVKTIDVFEEPSFVRVGPSYGVSVAVWTKEGAEEALIRRYVYVEAKSGGYVIIGEAPAERFQTAGLLFESLVQGATFADPAFTGGPPKESAGEVPGPGWPLQFKDRFGLSQVVWTTQPVTGAGYSGTLSVKDNKAVLELDATQLVASGGRSRVGKGATVGDDCRNCYVSVDMQNLAKTAAPHGIMLRAQGSEAIVVLVDDLANSWRVAYISPGAPVEDLVPYSPNANLKPGQVNKLAVMANGNQIVVWVNGRKLGEAQLTKGALVGPVGLYWHPHTLGKMHVTYDNLEMRRPD